MPNKNALGGRGKKAPYKTEHYRIPAPIKPLVQALANHYRELASQNKGELSFADLVDQIKEQAISLDQAKLIKVPTISAYEFTQNLYRVWFTEAETKAGRDCFGQPILLATLAQKMELETKTFLALLTQVESDLLELIPTKKKNYKVDNRRVGALTFHTPLSVRPDHISVSKKTISETVDKPI
ncbi:hypothetical protein Syn7502_03340 [Synechococcus sp. PCC 7502]|uniref:hypothetical protein n=1 Tax=Synechococcus sp. PCC 7502 TaxID=1173263 RepID=UPI00029FFFC7|nr:hypothetical protein [Synechococcus sp. PCC 7502]AFY75202.1 hypothetical protein Syn7502_03340 [Synechococcus sp. PCC 7502]